MGFIKDHFSLKKSLAALFFLTLVLVMGQNCSSPGSNSGAPKPSPQPGTTKTCFEQLGTNSEWSNDTQVIIDGYPGQAMEPQISSDQVTLFFNNKTASDTEMDVHYAIRQPNGHYKYIGVLSGTSDPNDLDGVPTLDLAGNFYFTSTRTYGTNFRTLYGGQITLNAGNPNDPLSAINVAAADTSLGQGEYGKVDMDMAVSWDGSVAVVSRAYFANGNWAYPETSRLEIFNVASRQIAVNALSDTLLQNVNLSGCKVYAPNLSADLKELYYAMMVETSPGNFDFRVVVAKRANTSDPFGNGSIISAIPAMTAAEGPSISYDDGGKTLYYHRRDPNDGKFKIYKVTRQ